MESNNSRRGWTAPGLREPPDGHLFVAGRSSNPSKPASLKRRTQFCTCRRQSLVWIATSSAVSPSKAQRMTSNHCRRQAFFALAIKESNSPFVHRCLTRIENLPAKTAKLNSQHCSQIHQIAQVLAQLLLGRRIT